MSEHDADKVWLGIAARLWNAGLDTFAISIELNVLESQVYNRLEDIMSIVRELRRGHAA